MFPNDLLVEIGYPETSRMMTSAQVEQRVEQLCASPAGCVLLLKVREGDLPIDQVVDPVIAMQLVSSAVGEVTPWFQDHDWLVGREKDTRRGS